jgi:hypothetical protein
MQKFKVVFYEEENCSYPVEEFLNSLDLKMRVNL